MSIPFHSKFEFYSFSLNLLVWHQAHLIQSYQIHLTWLFFCAHGLHTNSSLIFNLHINYQATFTIVPGILPDFPTQTGNAIISKQNQKKKKKKDISIKYLHFRLLAEKLRKILERCHTKKTIKGDF